MGGAVKGIGGAVGGIAQNLKLTPGIGDLVGQILAGGAPRERFVAVLLATVAHVNKKPGFNLEVEINDLLVRLGNLRQEGSGTIGSATSAFLAPGIERLLKDIVSGASR